jgi:hypothetical protein
MMAFAGGCSPARDRAVTTTSDRGTTSSPSGDTVAARGHSMVRVINAVSNGAQITLLADERTIFDNVKAAQVTDYKEMSDNAVKFSVRSADQPSASGEGVNREVMGDGQRYTAVVLPKDNGKDYGLRVLHDELTPDSGKARIRVIHAAAGTGEVDVVLNGHSGELFSGLNFGNEGGFKDIDPTTGTLEVRRKDEKLQIATVKDMRLDAGHTYTVVIMGGPKAPLKTVTFEDQVSMPRQVSQVP